MNTILRPIIFSLSILLSAGCGNAQETNKSNPRIVKEKAEAKKPADSEKEKIELLLLRSSNPQIGGYMHGAMWTAIHDYKDYENVDRVLSKFQSFWKAFVEYQNGNEDDLKALGGFAGYVDFLVNTMEGDDQAFRAFAAVMAGVSGAREFGPALARLSERKEESDELIVYDRGRAAMAIGMIGAGEYTPDLVKMLESENAQDRGGAALGLGYLKAGMHREKIEALLRDTDESVQENAKGALILMDGK